MCEIQEEVEEAPSKATQLASKLKTAAYIESSTGMSIQAPHPYSLRHGTILTNWLFALCQVPK